MHNIVAPTSQQKEKENTMSTMMIFIGGLFALSFIVSIVVVAACALSSQVSQDLEWSDQAEYYEDDVVYEDEYDYHQESILA